MWYGSCRDYADRFPAPRRRGAPGERERQIVDAAVAVFGERGTRARSMDAVAERVGVTAGALYTHLVPRRSAARSRSRGPGPSC
ncbi:helix-turn-helix transcriptional regulator [Pseudonocardia sp. MCCB 268]|nr:helix-turn-helix transcriptional regulator [Pseudonocardia cytotoxica]